MTDAQKTAHDALQQAADNWRENRIEATRFLAQSAWGNTSEKTLTAIYEQESTLRAAYAEAQAAWLRVAP